MTQTFLEPGQTECLWQGMESHRPLGFHDIHLYPTHCKRDRVSGYPKWQIFKDWVFLRCLECIIQDFQALEVTRRFFSQQCFFYSHRETCAILEKIARKPERWWPWPALLAFFACKSLQKRLFQVIGLSHRVSSFSIACCKFGASAMFSMLF